MLKAIETKHKGYRFRSRLEARWTVFFDALGIKWQYESEGFDLDEVGRYLPDFWLPQVHSWAEVKPETFTYTELRRCSALQKATGYDVVLLDGPPDFRSYFIYDDLPTDYLMNSEGQISRITDGGYPGEEYDLPVPWVDVIVSNGYLNEGRFFTNTGYSSWPRTLEWEPVAYTGAHDHPEQYRDAVFAARSARFER